MNKPTAKILTFPNQLAAQLRFDAARPLSLFAVPMAGSYAALLAGSVDLARMTQASGYGLAYSIGATAAAPEPAWKSAPIVPMLAQVIQADREFDASFETHNHAALKLMADAELVVELALMKAAIESQE